MPLPDDVAALARAIAERHSVDWASAQASTSPEWRDAVHELKVIAEIAAFHGGTKNRAPQTWGAFRILELAGHGTYGHVYRAIDPRLDREVALKLMPPADAAIESHMACIEEARLLARVRHPNVVTIYGADWIDGRVGLWMEFVRGRTLEQALQQDGPLAPRDLAIVCRDVCRALDAVHRELGETGGASLERYVASAMGSSERALKTQRSSVDAAFAAVLGTGAHEAGTDVRTKTPSVPRSLLSGAAIGIVWVYIFDPRYGLMRTLLDPLGLNSPNWLRDTTWALPAIIIVYVWKNVGFATIIYLAGLLGVLFWMRAAGRVQKHALYLVGMLSAAVVMIAVYFLMGRGHVLGTGHVGALIALNGLVGFFASTMWFVPPSLVNHLRRDAIASLEVARAAGYERPVRGTPVEPPVPYPEDTLSYLANVFNQKAHDFYAKHGVKVVGAAYESHEELGEVSLMITKHCVRLSMSLCPKQAKGVVGVKGTVKAEPLQLINGSEKLTLRFDCKPCEMHVVGRMKKSVLNAQKREMQAVPMQFYRTRPSAGSKQPL